MATQAERSAGTKARLLEAALGCLVERGYFGTSTAEVCRRAGVTRGAQLHHYPTKAALLGAAVEHVMTLRHDEFRRVVDGGPRRLDRVLDALWSIYAGPTVAAWQELVVAARTEPELHEVVRRVNHRFEREAEVTFRELFPAVPEARVAAGARLVMALFDGLALNHGLDGDDALARAVARELARVLGSSGAWTGRRRGRA